MENRTAGIIQETRKKIKKKPSLTRNQQIPEIQADLEIQLKASRDVRWLLCIIYWFTAANIYLFISAAVTSSMNDYRIIIFKLYSSILKSSYKY